MQCGFVLPDIDLKNIGNLAREAEQAGWDGIFIPDCISIQTKSVPAFPFFDPWVALGLVAVATSRIRFGTMVTAVPRRRPWKLARETMTLDHLSNGRLILAVGLGAAADDAGFYKVGEKMDLKSRAELLDEGLEILAGCWSGKPFSFHGKHYQVDDMTLAPPPIQSPRIPVWVVGVWPKTKSVNRALRWDGIIPQKYKPQASEIYMKPEEIAELRAYVKQIAKNRERSRSSHRELPRETTANAHWKRFSHTRRPAQLGGWKRCGAPPWKKCAPESSKAPRANRTR